MVKRNKNEHDMRCGKKSQIEKYQRFFSSWCVLFVSLPQQQPTRRRATKPKPNHVKIEVR
jgi:hypothetical protein